jgi:hypothetical protein
MAQGALAAPKLVYRVDSATAQIENGRLVVTASGAVKSGGWTRPVLRLHGSPQADTLVMDFAATPPRSKRVVVQAILPITVTLKAAPPHDGTVQVKLVSQTNSVTVPIVRHATAATTPLRPARVARSK